MHVHYIAKETRSASVQNKELFLQERQEIKPSQRLINIPKHTLYRKNIATVQLNEVNSTITVSKNISQVYIHKSHTPINGTRIIAIAASIPEICHLKL